MALSEELRTILIKDLHLTEVNIKTSRTAEEILYNFSSSFGMINRIMNIDCDPMLVFMHQILQSVHQAFNNRLNTPRNVNTESFLATPRIMLDKLIGYYSELLNAYENDDNESIYLSLNKIANLTYATTGNGFYLFKMEKLKI